jgi:hypothetical protein
MPGLPAGSCQVRRLGVGKFPSADFVLSGDSLGGHFAKRLGVAGTISSRSAYCFRAGLSCFVDPCSSSSSPNCQAKSWCCKPSSLSRIDSPVDCQHVHHVTLGRRAVSVAQKRHVSLFPSLAQVSIVTLQLSNTRERGRNVVELTS